MGAGKRNVGAVGSEGRKLVVVPAAGEKKEGRMWLEDPEEGDTQKRGLNEAKKGRLQQSWRGQECAAW